MANVRDTNDFSDGLDSDNLSQDIKPNDYRYALNIRNGVAYIRKKGGVTGVKGNVLIPKTYFSYGTPTGTSKTIGSYEDLQFNTIIFFVWNSNGGHGIYRYFPDLISTGNPFGEIHQVAFGNVFGWLQNTQITSINHISGKNGVLLYWCDNIQGRRLNITKSDLVNKFKSWTTYMPKSFTNFGTQSFSFDINAVTGGSLLSLVINTTTAVTNFEEFFAFTANAINTNAIAQQYVTATAYPNKIVITETQSNTVLISFFSLISQTVPLNWYGTTITERFIDEGIWPSWLSPLVTFGANPNVTFNNVKNQVWQFRTFYLTNDFEKSLLSPFTQVPVNELVNGGLQVQSYNYLHIDFNDAQLIPYLTEIQYFNVTARSGNTGTEQGVAQLQIPDFLDYDFVNNAWICNYDFYNDTTANILDPIFVQQQESGVPINNEAQELVQNRLVKLNITDGLDPVEPSISVTQEFQDTQEDYVYITAVLRIYNCTMDGVFSPAISPSNAIQPIVKYASLDASNPTLGEKYPQFGGFISDPSVPNTTMSDRNNNIGQLLPLGGFLFYSAGTDSWGLSEQQQQTQGGIGQYLPTTLGTVLDVNAANQDNVQKFLHYQSGDPYKIQNTVTFKVKKGIHTVRLASRWCSFGDVLGKGPMYDLNNGREYQTTSTNVYAINPFIGGAFQGYDYNKKEITIDLTNAVSGSSNFIGEFVVEDCREIWNTGNFATTILLCGYLLNAPSQSNPSDFAGAPKMEYQVLYFLGDMGTNTMFTDHNGYFYRSAGLNSNTFGRGVKSETGFLINSQLTTSPTYIALANAQSNRWQQINTTIYLSTSILNALQANNLQPIAYNQGNNGNYYPEILNSFGNQTAQLLLVYKDDVISASISTEIEGSLVDSNNNGISNAIVYSTFCGRFSPTAQNGSYKLLVYATVTAGIPSPPPLYNVNPPLPGDVIFPTTPSTSDNLLVLYNSTTNNINNNNQVVSLPYPPFNITTPFTATTFQLVANYAPYGKGLKRGVWYQASIRGKDADGRLTTMNTNQDCRFYIPYITEDLNKYFPNQYAPNTYLHGKPTITIALNFTPPSEWVSYDICLTPNQYEYYNYLQWVANRIEYVSTIGLSIAELNVQSTTNTTTTTQGGITTSVAVQAPQTTYNPPVASSYQAGDATNIYIGISNLVDYQNANPGSILSYVYQAGDRLRLIADNNGIFYTSLYELNVVGYDTITNSIIVQNDSSVPKLFSGTLFEVLHPRYRTDLDEQIFYEVGESFLCTAPNTPNNAFSVNPVQLTCGDTYWRNRQYLVNDTADYIFFSTSYLIEDPNLSDFFKSASWDIGRDGINDPYDIRLNIPTEILVSDIYQTDSNSNGLCNFPALNFKILDANYGAGQRLILLGDILHVICTNRSISDYIGQRVLSESKELNGPVSISNDFLGTNRAQVKEIGTIHPASVQIKDGYIYGLDAPRSIVWRDANDGMTEISRAPIIGKDGVQTTTMQSFFKELCQGGLFFVTAGIDKYYNEYILTATKLLILEASVTSFNKGTISPAYWEIDLTQSQIDQINASCNGYIKVRFFDRQKQSWIEGYTPYTVVGLSIHIRYSNAQLVLHTGDSIFLYYGGKTDTIAWNEDGNRWKTHYSFQPECYGKLGDLLYSFNGGTLWIHDKNPIYNNFYNTQYASIITPIANKQPDIIKVWLALGLELLQSDDNNNVSVAISNRYGQLSALVPQNFALKERQYFSAFKRDSTDTSVANPLVNGKNLRSEELELQITNNFVGEFILRAINVLSFISERSGK